MKLKLYMSSFQTIYLMKTKKIDTSRTHLANSKSQRYVKIGKSEQNDKLFAEIQSHKQWLSAHHCERQ